MEEFKQSLEEVIKGFIALAILGFVLWVGIGIDEIRKVEIAKMANFAPNVVLTETETKAYESALKQVGLTDEETQLSSWVNGLKKAKKTGVLPTLPKDFTDPEIIWVKEKAILVSGSK
jgi:predicted negative regulator of RcsB-dependent stress response